MPDQAPTATTAPLPSPPFIHVPGLPNFRDAGGYPISPSPSPSPSSPSSSSGSSSSKPQMIRRGILYRSSEPSGVSDDGIATLQRLGIGSVYDLRSAAEITRGLGGGAAAAAASREEVVNQAAGGEEVPKGWKVREWEGARRVFVPVFLDYDYSPEALALRYRNYTTDSEEGFVQAYADILSAASSATNEFQPFKTILGHLASSESTPVPCLVHCTAGKDRTGVVCALALSLCGVSDDVVAHEYSLTELGLRPRFAELVGHIQNIPELRDNIEGAKRMLGSRRESMLRTLASIRQKHGSVEECVIELGFLTPEGIAQLRKNLIVDASEEDVIPWQEHAKLI